MSFSPAHRCCCVLAFLLAASALMGCGSDDGTPRSIAKLLVRPPQILPEFELQDEARRPFTRERFIGKWSLVFFGYTHCPDVCPVTLSELAGVYQQLQTQPELSRDLQVVFVSVDPARDDPAQLKNFVRYFNERFIALTGTLPQLNAFTEPLHVRHARLTDQGPDYRVEHSADVLLIDPQARLYAKFPAPHYGEEIAKQFTAIAHHQKGES